MTASKASESLTPRTDEQRKIARALVHNEECIWEWAQQLERETSPYQAEQLADARDDVKRLHEEKMQAIDRAIKLERDLSAATARAAKAKVRELQEAKRPWTPEFTKSVVDGQVSEIDRLTALVKVEREKVAEAERDRDALNEFFRLNPNSLGAKLQAAELDAGRYRFLRGDRDSPLDRWRLWCVKHWGKAGDCGMSWDDVQGETLDALIDAALCQSAP